MFPSYTTSNDIAISIANLRMKVLIAGDTHTKIQHRPSVGERFANTRLFPGGFLYNTITSG